jgi:hypothetical protein
MLTNLKHFRQALAVPIFLKKIPDRAKNITCIVILKLNCDMEKFYYFGYASNLDIQTLKSRLKSDPINFGIAVLPHFGFRFNHPNPDGTARANIIPSKNESVYGLLFEVAEWEREYFMTSEPGYDFIEQEVFTAEGKVRAFTFTSKKIKPGIFPLESYWKTILKGGKENGLPGTYLSQILNRAGASSLMK